MVKMICALRLLFLASVLAASARADVFVVTEINFGYTPSSITINVGDTVDWQNIQGFHSLSQRPASFFSSELPEL